MFRIRVGLLIRWVGVCVCVCVCVFVFVPEQCLHMVQLGCGFYVELDVW